VKSQISMHFFKVSLCNNMLLRNGYHGVSGKLPAP